MMIVDGLTTGFAKNEQAILVQTIKISFFSSTLGVTKTRWYMK
jgi:hypothetical protein